MYHFTILERMALESIHKSDKTLEEIADDTGLEIPLCMNIVYSLLAKNLVVCAGSAYSVNKNLSDGIIRELKDRRNRAVEVNALVRECVKESFMENGDSFHFKKVYMSEKDKKLLKAMFYNIESFLDGLKNQTGATKEETFIFWGGDNYAKTVGAYIA